MYLLNKCTAKFRASKKVQNKISSEGNVIETWRFSMKKTSFRNSKK